MHIENIPKFNLQPFSMEFRDTCGVAFICFRVCGRIVNLFKIEEEEVEQYKAWFNMPNPPFTFSSEAKENGVGIAVTAPTGRVFGVFLTGARVSSNGS